MMEFWHENEVSSKSVISDNFSSLCLTEQSQTLTSQLAHSPTGCLVTVLLGNCCYKGNKREGTKYFQNSVFYFRGHEIFSEHYLPFRGGEGYETGQGDHTKHFSIFCCGVRHISALNKETLQPDMQVKKWTAPKVNPWVWSLSYLASSKGYKTSSHSNLSNLPSDL